jgi:hypothetical protein
MTIRPFIAASLSGLAFLGVLLGVPIRPAAAQQAADDFSDAIGAIATRTSPDANGNRITEVTIDGSLGQVSFVLDEKQAAAVLGDHTAGLSMDLGPLSKVYVQHAQESFGATDEEWKALTPKIMKVRRLKLQLSSHGKYGRSQADGLTALAKAWGALGKVLAKKEAAAAEIKPLLQAVNDAEAKVKEDLRQAEKELKDLLTVRQEAMLVRLGIFE